MEPSINSGVDLLAKDHGCDGPRQRIIVGTNRKLKSRTAGEGSWLVTPIYILITKNHSYP